MYTILVIIMISLMAALLFVNLYFRIRVLKLYRKLLSNRIEFTVTDIFDREALENEVLPRYPQHQDDINSFVNHIRFSIRCAMAMIVIISAFGAVLMWYR